MVVVNQALALPRYAKYSVGRYTILLYNVMLFCAGMGLSLCSMPCFIVINCPIYSTININYRLCFANTCLLNT